MSRDEIIRMAQEAQQERLSLDGRSPSTALSGYWFLMDVADLARFAALIRADEREACAKLIEPSEEHRRDASWGYIGGEEGVEMLDAMAAKIRARKP